VDGPQNLSERLRRKEKYIPWNVLGRTTASKCEKKSILLWPGMELGMFQPVAWSLY